MTPAELKRNTAQTNPYFFTRKSMKFFDDTMANYGVRLIQVPGHPQSEVWELYRRRPVKHKNQASAYFDKNTFVRVWPQFHPADTEPSIQSTRYNTE